MRCTLTALGVALILVGFTSSGRPDSSRSPLRIQLQTYLQGDELWVALLLNNRSDTPVYLNKIDIGMSSQLLNSLFVIKQKQQDLAYRGPLVKRRSPTAVDFVLLKPKQSVQTKIRLDKAYAFKPGKHRYSIQYKQYHSSPLDPALLTEFTSAVHHFTYTFP